jgi:signal transduction histidine kinase
VRHLRNFFRERATDLQLAAIAPLVQEVVQSQLTHAEARNVALSWQCDAGVPPVWLDRVQILVVLRNLVANAMDAAAAAQGAAPAWVKVSARAAAGQVVVDVRDSGSGIAPDEVLRVFDTRASSKPGGMGIGLGISRSIVQAHGGRMWAEPGPGGRFCFSVPVSPARAHE